MLNQVVLVGRLIETPTIQKTENRGKFCNIKLAIPRSYKNEEGIYETDNINAILGFGIMEKTCEFCTKGDLIGIKGRIEERDNQLCIIAEKVSFLSTKRDE